MGKRNRRRKSPEYLYVVFDDELDEVSFSSVDPLDILSDMGERECECLRYKLDKPVRLRSDVVEEEV